jgi:spoIIIJ-associated protein
VAHAEASARSVEAAATAAAAKLGLRSDQVEVEVLQDPTPSTFGVIGSPARVRVTPRIASPGATSGAPPLASSAPTSVQDPHATESRTPLAKEPEVPKELGTRESVALAAGSTDDDRTGSSGAGRDEASEQLAGKMGGGVAGSDPVRPTDSEFDRASDGEASGPVGTAANSGPPGPVEVPGEQRSTAVAPVASAMARPPRRDHRDDLVEPEMVEADTERAGDFLEGLLDALDVDGDITTWVDEVGGHIDLEGSDLDALVGPNGETLDALQELTRLAVLRQSKRRVRLLLDINGFRAQRREQLVAVVKATVEQVLQTREDQELRPMTPAERKIVHDAVAAIEGAQTESLGEEPNRRVVIRPI